MRNLNYFASLLFVCSMLMIVTSAMSQNKIYGDTLITKDLMNPNREYWEIRTGTGGILQQGFMAEGKKDGLWREYSEGNGKLSKMEEYSHGKRNGASITVHINGSITSDVTYMNDSLNGISTHMSNYGNVKLMETYNNGILDGRRRMFYDGGQLQEDGMYKNGQRIGLTKWYKGDGTISAEHTYSNGILNGPAKEYDEKGRIKMSGQFLNNNETGEWQVYQDSVLVKKVIYKDGQIVKETPVKVKNEK
jgi:antitoxin component YwqK of YwqJK toxin-antitoxin module